MRDGTRTLATVGGGALLAFLLGACAGASPSLDPSIPFKDGTYSGVSAPDEEDAVGEVTLTVKGGAVVEASFEVVAKDGTPKDESYGKDSGGRIANSEYYAAAQKAVAAFDVYAAQLVEVGVPEDVDVISGATWAHDQFVQAATAALLKSQGSAPAGSAKAQPAGKGDVPDCCDEDQ
jgi:major membrane immunogen (membrane-anchored lipoprotein)